MNQFWFAFGVVLLFLTLLLLLPILQGKSQPDTPPRASWQLPSIPTWAWWTVGVAVGALVLYFLVPWLKGLFGFSPSEGTTSTIGGWIEGNLGIMAVIVITIGLVVVRSRGYTGGGMVMVGIALMSIVIGIWFLLGERAPVAFSQLRTRIVSTILDDTDDSKDGPPMTKVEWPVQAYNGDLTIKPGVWSKPLWFKPNCGVKHNGQLYGRTYVAEHLNQNGQERVWVAPETGPDHQNTQAMRFKLLVPDKKFLEVLQLCGREAWME